MCRRRRKIARTSKVTANAATEVVEYENVTPRPPHPLSNPVLFTAPGAVTSIVAANKVGYHDEDSLSLIPSPRSNTDTTDNRGAKRKRSISPVEKWKSDGIQNILSITVPSRIRPHECTDTGCCQTSEKDREGSRAVINCDLLSHTMNELWACLRPTYERGKEGLDGKTCSESHRQPAFA